MALRRSFDHLARPYALLERSLFGDGLECARFAHLEVLAEAKRVLVAGEGDGRTVERLLRIAPHCHVDVIDKSPAMIARARQRIAGDARVTFHNLDIREFQVGEPYDALTTSFFLDCFEEPELTAVVSRLARLLAPNGSWLYSDFLPARTGLRQRFWLGALYAAFGLLTDIEARRLVDPEPALRRAGLVRKRRSLYAHALLTSELWIKPSAVVQVAELSSRTRGSEAGSTAG